ncbi:hypothetical protein POTOM_053160 [Populus tomentosa]|uniref:Large ribosomal subunit protein bL17c n=1 Tax=Populus tomentosa TaxID=118781 RepID=A0A8X7Y5F2_POPTO|nr:hypothetical protein POTOM_053160 [Populus tomentosa]
MNFFLPDALIYVSPVDTWNLQSRALNRIAGLDNKGVSLAVIDGAWLLSGLLFLLLLILLLQRVPQPLFDSHHHLVANASTKASASLRLAANNGNNKSLLVLSPFLTLFSPLVSPVISLLFFQLPIYNVTCGHVFPDVDNGSRFFAMRHGRRVPKLNRPPDQRRALLRGLTTQLLKHGRIKTTRARASAMRKYVDKMITLAKDGSLHKRRQALGFIYEKQIVHALFAEVPDRYGERNGGYTRIIRTLPRRGDNAPMAYIELV